MPLNAKQAGASYEAQFTADALKRGLNVLQPFGDYLPYDLIVENKRAETFRVQVKGTTHKQKGKNHAYRTTAASGNHRIGKNKITPDKQTYSQCTWLQSMFGTTYQWRKLPLPP